MTFSFLLSIGTLLFAWLRTRRQDVEDRFKIGSDRMKLFERRLDSLEKDVEAKPAKDEMHQIELHLAGLAGEMKAMAASQRGTNDILRRLESVVGRHEDHLLETGKR